MSNPIEDDQTLEAGQNHTLQDLPETAINDSPGTTLSDEAVIAQAAATVREAAQAQEQAESSEKSADQLSESDLKAQMKALTLRALTESSLEPQQVKKVVDDLIEGALQGLPPESHAHETLLKQALAGIEEALLETAQVTIHSLQKAKSEWSRFEEESLTPKINALLVLPDVVEAVLEEKVRESQYTGEQVMQSVLKGIKASRSVTHALLKSQVAQFKSQLKETLKEGVSTAKTLGSLFAEASAGLLEGVAEALKQGRKS